MKNTELIAIKPFCTFLLPILVGSTGCLTSDNNVGSVGNDSGVVDGSRQDASGANPASTCATDADCPTGLSCGYPVADGCAAKGVCIQSNCQGGACITPQGMCGCDGQGIVLPVQIQKSGNSITILYLSAPSSGRVGPCTGISVPDAAAPDVAIVGKDAAQASPSADAAAPDVANVGKDAAQESTSLDSGTACLYPPGSDTSTDAGNGSFVGCRPEPASDLCDQSLYTMTCHGSGSVPSSIPQPASSLKCRVIPIPTPSNTLFYCCPCAGSPFPDAAAPDVASGAKDAAPDLPEAGAAHQCQLIADGTCSAVTSNTTCTRFIGHRYDESAGCYSMLDATLGCCATASGEVCALPTASGCYQIAVDGGTVAYWTPALTTPAVTIPGGQACDQTRNLVVPGAHSCGATLPDAAASPDAHVPVSLPLCTTDDDCCVSVDTCYGTATLGGKAGWGPVPGTHAASDICLPCLPPAVQVQCQNGFCVGEKLDSHYAPLTTSHCGYIALPDAGATPAVSPHAVVDGGTVVESYRTTWGC